MRSVDRSVGVASGTVGGVPGWHPDPSATGNGDLRWWDGGGWTEHRLRSSGCSAAAGAGVPGRSPGLDDRVVHLLLAFLSADDAGAPAVGALPPGPSAAQLLLTALQEALGADEVLVDLRYPFRPVGEQAAVLVAVTDRRLLVVAPADPALGPQVSAEAHERVRLRRPSGAVASPAPLVVRDGDGLTVTLRRADRRVLESVLSGGRWVPGPLTELLDVPPPQPGAPAPGWYPDPEGQAERRFWDGTAWSRRDLRPHPRKSRKNRLTRTPLGSFE